MLLHTLASCRMSLALELGSPSTQIKYNLDTNYSGSLNPPNVHLLGQGNDKYSVLKQRETVPSQTSDMSKKTVSVLAH